MIFNVVFAVLCVLCALLLLHQRRRSSTVSEVVAARDFVQFQRCYLVVYVCAVFGDWLQGPYVYALYAAYGFSKTQIALLFITGFGASGILGIFAGQAADKYGRCRLCCVYCVTYIVSCLTKHSANFYMLLFGRLTGGVATSILFSAFESWLVAAHDKRSFPRDLLSQTLSLATLLNSSAALAAAWLGALVRTSFTRSWRPSTWRLFSSPLPWLGWSRCGLRTRASRQQQESAKEALVLVDCCQRLCRC